MTEYVGNELELFKEAHNWKAYFGALLWPHILGDVLEVGGGIGSTAKVLAQPQLASWTALEPDPSLATAFRQSVSSGFPCPVQVITGTLDSLDSHRTFDTILYIDVLEHIEDDRGELLKAAARLRKGGALIVLAPAHQFLFSEFDARIGHFRRYSRASLGAVAPPSLTRIRLEYLDSVGMVLSAANKMLLHQDTPRPRQIRFWDSVIIPLSRIADPLLARTIGKTVFVVWVKG